MNSNLATPGGLLVSKPKCGTVRVPHFGFFCARIDSFNAQRAVALLEYPSSGTKMNETHSSSQDNRITFMARIEHRQHS